MYFPSLGREQRFYSTPTATTTFLLLEGEVLYFIVILNLDISYWGHPRYAAESHYIHSKLLLFSSRLHASTNVRPSKVQRSNSRSTPCIPCKGSRPIRDSTMCSREQYHNRWYNNDFLIHTCHCGITDVKVYSEVTHGYRHHPRPANLPPLRSASLSQTNTAESVSLIAIKRIENDKKRRGKRTS